MASREKLTFRTSTRLAFRRPSLASSRTVFSIASCRQPQQSDSRPAAILLINSAGAVLFPIGVRALLLGAMADLA